MVRILSWSSSIHVYSHVGSHGNEEALCLVSLQAPINYWHTPITLMEKTKVLKPLLPPTSICSILLFSVWRLNTMRKEKTNLHYTWLEHVYINVNKRQFESFNVPECLKQQTLLLCISTWGRSSAAFCPSQSVSIL